MVGRTVQQRIDPCHGDLLLANHFRAAALDFGQFQRGFQHVLFGHLVGFVSHFGDVAELRGQVAVGRIDSQFSPGLIVVGQRHGRSFGQTEPNVVNVSAGGIGFGLGDGALQRPLATPGELLRGRDHPAPVLSKPLRAQHEAEHRVVERNHLRIAFGGRLPRGKHGLNAGIAGLDGGSQFGQRKLACPEQIVLLRRRFRIARRHDGRLGMRAGRRLASDRCRNGWGRDAMRGRRIIPPRRNAAQA